MISSLVLLGLFAILLLPGLYMLFTGRHVSAIILVYVLLFAGLGIYHVGLPGLTGPDLPRPPTVATREGEIPPQVCRNLMREVAAAKVFIGKPEPERVTVRDEVWSQLPKMAQDAILACVKGTRLGGELPEVVRK